MENYNLKDLVDDATWAKLKDMNITMMLQDFFKDMEA